MSRGRHLDLSFWRSRAKAASRFGDEADLPNPLDTEIDSDGKEYWRLGAGNVFRAVDDFDTTLCFILASAYLPLVLNAGARYRYGRTIVEKLQTPSVREILLFFCTDYFVNELENKQKMTNPVNFQNENMVATLVYHNSDVGTTVRRKHISLRMSVALPNIFNNWKLERFSVL